jgi:PIN domain nuclease of toxin-antitoxin system
MSEATGATPAKVPHIFDSSASIALLGSEPGGAVVAGLIADPHNALFAHSVNMCEVFYHFGPPSQPGNLANSKAAVALLKTLGIQERGDIDEAFWQDVALLIAERRAMPRDPAKPKHKPTLALGDAFGLALARRLGGVFVTGDRSEIEPMEKAGFCRVVFIK